MSRVEEGRAAGVQVARQQVGRRERRRKRRETESARWWLLRSSAWAQGFLRCWLREQVAENDQTNKPQLRPVMI